MATCSNCKASKPIRDFRRSSNRVSGHQGWCRQCQLDAEQTLRDQRTAVRSGPLLDELDRIMARSRWTV